MTDDEQFAAICADFPFDSAALERLHRRLDALVGKAQNGPPYGKADGTIDRTTWFRLRHLSDAMGVLLRAMRCVEEDGDPFDGVDDIPF